MRLTTIINTIDQLNELTLNTNTIPTKMNIYVIIVVVSYIFMSLSVQTVICH